MANGREVIITNNLNNPSIKSLLLIDEFNNKIGDALLIIDLEKKEAILESIFIEEKYRKQQYGSLLIYKIFEICHSNNIENLILLSDPTNVTVGEFYEKLGFTYAWNKILEMQGKKFETDLLDEIFNKRDDIKKWKNIKIKEIFIDFDKSKSKAINDEQKILEDSEILSSILDEVLIHEESIFKEDYQKVIDWFNQQREQIIKNPKQWWNTLTPKQVDVVKNEAKKWWNNLTPEQRKIKLLEKQAYQKKTIKKDDTPLLCDFDQNIKNKLESMQSMKTSTPVFKKDNFNI